MPRARSHAADHSHSSARARGALLAGLVSVGSQSTTYAPLGTVGEGGEVGQEERVKDSWIMKMLDNIISVQLSIWG